MGKTPFNSDQKRLLGFWREELDGATLYEGLAALEPDEKIAGIYRRMAQVERQHAARWADKLQRAGLQLPAFSPSFRTRTLLLAARLMGVQAVLPTVISQENDGGSHYQSHPGADDMAADEQSHARVLKHIAKPQHGGVTGDDVAQAEGRHRGAGGNALRAAVLGATAGLVSNLSLVMGVAGASLQSSAILVTGLAGLLAGACSMALGEWLSVQSSRELYERQLAIEAQEIESAPEEEVEELTLIYQTRGLNEKEARTLASRIMSDREHALETLAREELGIDPAELGGSAWEAAITSFLLFATGAIMPVIPYFFTDGTLAILLSLLLSMIGLIVLGAGVTLFTGRPVLYSAGRQVLFGLAAAAITFGVGHLVGVTLV